MVTYAAVTCGLFSGVPWKPLRVIVLKNRSAMAASLRLLRVHFSGAVVEFPQADPHWRGLAVTHSVASKIEMNPFLHPYYRCLDTRLSARTEGQWLAEIMRR